MTSEHSGWMRSKRAVEYCDMTPSQWKHYSAAGLLPPCVRDTRAHKFGRVYLDTWMELRMRGLWADWKQLVQEHGERRAWDTMLGRLKEAS